MSTLKKIWENRAKIIEGITNSIIRDEVIEEIARHRMQLCSNCPSKGSDCAVPGTAPCCNECGCSLTFKTRSLSSDCPLDKWQAIATEEEEDKLDKLD